MFKDSIVQAIRKHAFAEYPRESCGLIVNNKYLPQINVSSTPNDAFEMEHDVYLKYETLGIDAVIHSHTNGNESPSSADMSGQLSTNLTWGLVVTDGNYCSEPYFWGGTTPRADLCGRSYHFGIHDCYSLIRDYYHEHLNINLGEVPRDSTVLASGAGLYLDNYHRLGFHKINAMEARVGDVFLAQIASNTVNHGGVLYSTDGRILHHLHGHLSATEPMYRWQKFITHWLRHEEHIHA